MGNSRTIKRYQTLDGLRGIAALAVVVGHNDRWYPSAPHLSVSAVDLFFLLSGFVIAAAYEPRLVQGMSVARFMATRLIRLYPLYLAGLLIAVTVLLLSYISHGEVTPFHLAFWKAVPFAVFMLPNPSFGVIGNMYGLNGPSWSLFFELCINFIYAMTYRHWTLRNMGFVIALIGIVIVIKPIILVSGWSYSNVIEGIFRVLFFFPIGVFLYRIETSIPVIRGLRAWHLLVIFVAILYCDFGPLTSLIIIPAYPVLVALALGVEPRGLTARACAKTGQWSYAIYAVHFPLIGLFLAVGDKLKTPSMPLLSGAAFIAFLLIFAELLDRYYDMPVRKWLSAQLSRLYPVPA